MNYRIYIDESGDHSYSRLDIPDRRYLGLTAVVMRKGDYDPSVIQGLEDLKRRHLRYDADNPPVLVRKQIMERRSFFSVLADPVVRREWDDDVIRFLSNCPMQVFSVVLDKQAHVDDGGSTLANPYGYCLASVLVRICSWLSGHGDGGADVVLESRGEVEDKVQAGEYHRLRRVGTSSSTAEEIRHALHGESLLFRRKEHNVAGLQIADLLAAEQKALTIQEHRLPMPRRIGSFGERINAAIANKVSGNGRVLV